jgi:hypothetical protein
MWKNLYEINYASNICFIIYTYKPYISSICFISKKHFESYLFNFEQSHFWATKEKKIPAG